MTNTTNTPDQDNIPNANSGDVKKTPKAVMSLGRIFERAADFDLRYFPIEIGVDAQKYYESRPSGYAGVKFYAEQGAIHGVHADVNPATDGSIAIAIEHWVHRPNGDNITTPFMTLKAEPAKHKGKDVMRITELVVQGEAINLHDRRAVAAAVTTCQQVLETLRLEQRMPMLGNIAKDAGLKIKPLPNTYKDGNARLAYEEGRKNITRSLRIPPQYVPAVTGFFQQGYAARPGQPVLFHAATRGAVSGGDKDSVRYSLQAEMVRGETADHTNVEMTLAKKDLAASHDYQDHNLVKLSFRPVRSEKGKGLVELSAATIGDRKQRVSDHKNMVRILHFAHDAMLDVRDGIVPDLGDIIGYTNTQKAISGVPALTKEEGARFTTRILGGNPTNEHLPGRERGLGANCFADHYEYIDDKGKLVTESLVRDVGIMALDRDKTGYDAKMAFAGDYYRHRNNPKHKPKYQAAATFITHWHYDHNGGVPHMLLAGYVMDHVICNAATKMHIEDICKKLDVPKEWMPKKWTVIDSLIDSKKELQISKHITAEFGWTPHSAPTNWVFVKTPKGSLFHYSDAKFDQTVESNPVFDVERITALKPTMVTVDSTRASFTGPIKREDDVKKGMVKFINESPDKAPVTLHIGTNAARLVTTADAYGETDRDTIVLGASLRFTKKVLEKIGRKNGKTLKEHARAAFGRRILNFTPTGVGVNAILNGDIRHHGLVVTGTHNEQMSILNRLIENKDQKNLGFITPQRYKFIVSQTGIPGSEKHYNEVIQFLERRGYEYVVEHASGHGGQEDVERMMDMAGAPYGLATHGDVPQRAHSAALMVKHGMTAINPSEQDVIQISDEKGCSIIGQEKSMMTYITIKRPKDQHFGGGEDVEYLTKIVPPEIKTPVGDMIREIADAREDNGDEKHRLKLRRAARDQHDAVLNIDGANLNPKQRRVPMSLPDYYIQNGFMRGITYDTETTQLGRYAGIHQFAAVQYDLLGDANEKWANYYQILPRTILPDLDALLTTNVMPSALYEKPPVDAKGAFNNPGELNGAFPPRLFYFKIKEFLEQSKQVSFKDEKGNEFTTSRLYIDAEQKPEDASRSKAKGDNGVNVYEQKTINYVLDPTKKKELKSPRVVHIKTMVDGANIFNADNMWMQQLAFAAGDLNYFPMSSGGIRSSDIRNKARMFAYLRPDKFKVRRKPENPDFPDFTVEGLMISNNLVSKKDGAAHEGRNDVIMERRLDQFMREIDPELYTRMTMNANKAEVKKYLGGTHNGMVYPRHLLTYVNRTAYKACANIGVYVGRSTERRYANKAVLFNVSDFDPKEFMHMGPQEIAEIMSDRNHRLHKAFEIISINKQPLVTSVERGIAIGANRGASLEQMKANKHFIERNPEMAANMVRAMEMARHFPDFDRKQTLEERVYSPAFMEMSAHDKALAKLFVPCAEEFASAKESDRINRERAHALDQFHSVQVRERYVAVLYRAQIEHAQLFGKTKNYLHPDDLAREKAKEKARIHGLIDTDAVSLGRLEMQIKRAHENWEERMAGKSKKDRALAEAILKETENLVQDIKTKIANNDPDWALSADDYRLLGLDDNRPYGTYQRPLAKSKVRTPKPPKQNLG